MCLMHLVPGEGQQCDGRGVQRRSLTSFTFLCQMCQSEGASDGISHALLRK